MLECGLSERVAITIAPEILTVAAPPLGQFVPSSLLRAHLFN
jgi:hypothetical protein